MKCHKLFPFNWESNDTIICNWMQLNNFLPWRIKWPGMTLSLLIQLWIKGNNCNNYMEWDAIAILPHLEEQRMRNNIIPLNSIENWRPQQYHLHAIGFNWISSFIEGSFNLEWHYLSQINWESKATIVSRITCNRIQ